MKPKFIKTAEKKKISNRLSKLYSLNLPDFQLIELQKNQIRAFSGSLNRRQVTEMSKITKIDSIGIHIIDNDLGDLKLTFDSLNILNPKKPIVQINGTQLDQWLKGHDLDLSAQKGTIILQHNLDLIGIAKSTGQKIFNSVPKDRKIKTAVR